MVAYTPSPRRLFGALLLLEAPPVIGWKRSGLALVLSLGAVYVGCTNDFNQFEPGNGFPTTSSSTGSGMGGQGGAGGEGGCTDNTQCNDLVSCTVDTCDTAAGACVFAQAPDGPVPGIADTPGDCFDQVCAGGVEKAIADDTETPTDDMNPCTTAVCMGGAPTTSFASGDTSCGANLVCDGMGNCVGCNTPAQCPAAPVCKKATCDKDTCGIEDQNQGTPCAGGICDGMGSCVECVDDTHCTGPSQVCTNAKCVLSCVDGATNGDETDLDCGGGACPTCADGKACDVGGDCASGACTGGTCAKPACNDNVKNGMETDTDCGGPTCDKCVAGDMCLAGADCESAVCTGGTCKAPACNDMLKNGTEADVDCGGPCPTKCADGLMCMIAADCASKVCTGAVCQVPACNDMAQNGMETDTDCGGAGGCPKCAFNQKCLQNSDCVSNKCMNGTCKN